MPSRGQAIWWRFFTTRAVPLQHEGKLEFPLRKIWKGDFAAKFKQLNSIDNMRVDGKFFVGSDIPEGQGSVNALLAECFDIAYDLRVQAEENDSDWLQWNLRRAILGQMNTSAPQRGVNVEYVIVLEDGD